MSKKIIFIVLIICVILGAFLIFNNNSKEVKGAKEIINDTNSNKTSSSIQNKKILVVYFSATNNTKNVAKKIAENLNADTFEIIPKEKYTSDDLDWTNEKSRVSKEHDDETLRNIELTSSSVDNFDSYDTVLIGYPIWWGVAAWPVNSFVKVNDFTGKTVIPFCTSSSSDLGQSGELLEKEAKSGNWLKGERFNSSPSNSDIKKFTDSIK